MSGWLRARGGATQSLTRQESSSCEGRSSSGKLKTVPPLCESATLHMLGPDAVHLLSVSRNPPEHMAARILPHPRMGWERWSPGLCFQVV
ncbi:hypothetical protein MG293_007883 [Ovis ammon polii]|uniref:Uncharacterized protein n=2 Tax=Ovis TaxID=9935 RepID=A0A836D4S7_SHEEP|nr:hypothetical protein JEQ12_008762 [Ovis aries]KAI4542504.1 hypothetical protein MG293_007883 [Ovis ammon polii]